MTDRISDLPGDLIHRVMSFLPAHEVVATCLLARGWRHTWKSAPALRITGFTRDDGFDSFVDFVHSLLLLRDPRAGLSSFEIDLDDGHGGFIDFVPDNNHHMDRWFRYAITRGVQELALRTTAEDVDYAWLPDAPIISRQLNRLELTKLDLSSRNLDLSGCPCLVHLKMDQCLITGDIFSLYLKNLSLIFCMYTTSDVRDRICTPNLVSLEIDDIHGMIPHVERMPFLVSSVVRLASCMDRCDCGDLSCYHSNSDVIGKSVLLDGLLQAMVLELSVDSKVFIVNGDLKLRPIFSKLKTLFLSEWCSTIAGDLNMLSCFLQLSPLLEKLILQLSKAPKIPVKASQGHCPPKKLLECSNLKKVEIKYDQDSRKRAQNIRKILRDYGIPTKKISIRRING